MTLRRRAAALSALLLVHPAMTMAQMGPVIPQGRCGIVIASENTLEALQFNSEVQTRRGQPIWLVETAKGRFAAIIGTAPMNTREGVIEQLKAEGLAGPDAFCTGPDKVSHIADEPPEGPMPHYTEVAAGYVAPERKTARAMSPEVEAFLKDNEDLAPRNPSSDIRISGISWDMSLREMAETLQARGMTCTNENPRLTCAKGDDSISISIFYYEFGCHTLNACGLSSEDVAQAVMQEFSIPEMSRTIRNDIERLCGVSPGGDRFCIVSIPFFGPVFSVAPTRSGSPDSITFD